MFDRYPDPSLPDDELLTLLDINLTRNDFLFDQKYFLQVKGTAMGKSWPTAQTPPCTWMISGERGPLPCKNFTTLFTSLTFRTPPLSSNPKSPPYRFSRHHSIQTTHIPPHTYIRLQNRHTPSCLEVFIPNIFKRIVKSQLLNSRICTTQAEFLRPSGLLQIFPPHLSQDI